MKLVESMSKKAAARRTVREGDGDCVTDFAVPFRKDDEGKGIDMKEKKEGLAFKVAQEINELADAADELIDDDAPAGHIAKAEWVASRMAERRMARKVDDEVRHHLAGMGCVVGLVACAKLMQKAAYAEYKEHEEKRAKHARSAGRKPRLSSREARYKAWAARKVAFGGDIAVFVGAVSDPVNGGWLKLPASDAEIEEAIERAQTGPDGEYYEEIMISDTDGLGNAVGEYDDIYQVNEWVEAIEDSGLDDDLIQALLVEYDLEYVADNIDDIDYFMDVGDERDLGYAVIEEIGWEGIGEDNMQTYFDYEAFGRDLVISDGYTIDNGFAYRVASRTALACEMHERMLVAFAEKNVKEKVWNKVKTCGKMGGGRKKSGRKAASMTIKAASRKAKTAQQDGWQGEGWYTFNLWDNEREQFDSPQKPEAVWVEMKYDFEEFSDASDFYGDKSYIVDYYGDGDEPNDPDVPIGEMFR